MVAKTKMNTAVGTIIRRLREDNNWSQQVIAEHLNISIPAYSKIETGVTDVNLSRLEQIAHFFNIGLSNLFGEDKTVSAPVSTQYTRLEKDLQEAEKEIILLQRKVIQLYDEIHQRRVSV
jgi:transcriptional regulator with XRE-family HTH domain